MNGDLSNHDRRITILETQVGRLVSDAESEKETRRRANIRIHDSFSTINKRLSNIERALWVAIGMFLMVEFIFRLLKIL